MSDDPHARCRYANDATLAHTPQGGHVITWPCGLRVEVFPAGVKPRYLLPELIAMHDEARVQRRRDVTTRSAAAKKRRRRMARRTRRRAPDETTETTPEPPARNTVAGP